MEHCYLSAKFNTTDITHGVALGDAVKFSCNPNHTHVITDSSNSVFICLSCAGQQSDVLRGQCLHRKECDRVPDAPGQVRSQLWIQQCTSDIIQKNSITRELMFSLFPLSIFAQSVNGAGGHSERHNSHPQRSAHKEESLLQVKMHWPMRKGFKQQQKTITLREIYFQWLLDSGFSETVSIETMSLLWPRDAVHVEADMRDGAAHVNKLLSSLNDEAQRRSLSKVEMRCRTIFLWVILCCQITVELSLRLKHFLEYNYFQ